MENKEIKITPPEGYEIDKEISTFDCIKFKPVKKKLTYEDIAKELFYNNEISYIDTNGKIARFHCFDIYRNLNNCLTTKQAEKLLAINKLLNVAKYLNGDWKPDWQDITQNKWYLEEETGKGISADSASLFNCRICYFKTKEFAEQAVEILGEDVVELALSTDW